MKQKYIYIVTRKDGLNFLWLHRIYGTGKSWK